MIARQPEEDTHARNDLGNNDNGDNEDGEADGQLSPRKQKSPNDERIDSNSTHGRSRGNNSRLSCIRARFRELAVL